MLKPIFVVAACILALMFAIKDGRVLRDSGLTGSCSAVVGSNQDAVVEACKPGKLEGRPDLTKRDCVAVGMRGKIEYWRCPADIQSTDAGR